MKLQETPKTLVTSIIIDGKMRGLFQSNVDPSKLGSKRALVELVLHEYHPETSIEFIVQNMVTIPFVSEDGDENAGMIFRAKPVEFYSYRTASPSGKILEEYDRRKAEVRDLEQKFAEKLGNAPDNHTMYQVIIDGAYYYVFFHDFIVILCTDIFVKDW